MAARFSAGQYEDAFTPHRLQNWSVARRCRQRPSPRDGSTQPVANDRGHLLPSVPRSQLNLTARSAAAAAQLRAWMQKCPAPWGGCGGLSAHTAGKPQQSRGAPGAALEPRSGAEDGRGAQPSPTAAAGEQRGGSSEGQNAALGAARGRNGAEAKPEGDSPPSPDLQEQRGAGRAQPKPGPASRAAP